MFQRLTILPSLNKNQSTNACHWTTISQYLFSGDTIMKRKVEDKRNGYKTIVDFPCNNVVSHHWNITWHKRQIIPTYEQSLGGNNHEQYQNVIKVLWETPW